MYIRPLCFTLMILSLPLFFGRAAYAQSVEGPTVVIYDGPNFQGPSRSFGIGRHRLLDFNDVASSIKVPKGLVVIVYEHAEEGGGFGEWVDFLEDQPDLYTYTFDNKISYLDIFASKRGSEVYVRNRMENGRFVERGWVQGGDVPINPHPVVAPTPMDPKTPVITSFEAEPKLVHQGQSTTLRWQTKWADRVIIGERYPRSQDPSTINWQGDVDSSGISRRNPARATVYVLRAEKGDRSTTKAVLVDFRPTFCSIKVRVNGDSVLYGTRVELHRTDGSQPVRTETGIDGTFRFERVPVGQYQIVPKGRPSRLSFSPRAETVTCRPNVPHSLVFSID